MIWKKIQEPPLGHKLILTLLVIMVV
jgi:hypothetical protein